MPKFIVKLTDKKKKKDYYMVWSTIIDSATGILTLVEAINWLKRNLVNSEIKSSIQNLATKGCSNPNFSIEDILDTNDEGCSTVDELINTYIL